MVKRGAALNDHSNVLCVCSFNRTRSVLMAALLTHHTEREGIAVNVTSAGTMSDGMPPTADTVRMLANRGLDVSRHSSRRVDEDLVRSSDLIVTAERDHVVAIAGQWPALFTATYTLPELVRRASKLEGRAGRSTADWLADVGAGRPIAVDYLDAPDVGDIVDPTGQPRQVWDRVFHEIDELTRRLALALK